MELLDVRSAKKNLQPLGLVAKKVHKQGTPSDCLPPPDAPSWAVQKGVYTTNGKGGRESC